MDEHTEKLPNPLGFRSAEITGRELACYLVLSELLIRLVKEGHLDQEQVDHILWTAGMRLYCIRCDVAEMQSSADGERLEDEGQHLLNLMDKDVETALRHFSRKQRRT